MAPLREVIEIGDHHNKNVITIDDSDEDTMMPDDMLPPPYLARNRTSFNDNDGDDLAPTTYVGSRPRIRPEPQAIGPRQPRPAVPGAPGRPVLNDDNLRPNTHVGPRARARARAENRPNREPEPHVNNPRINAGHQAPHHGPNAPIPLVRNQRDSVASNAFQSIQVDDEEDDHEDLGQPNKRRRPIKATQTKDEDVDMSKSRGSNRNEFIDLESPEETAGEGQDILLIEDVYEQEVEARRRNSKKSNIEYERRNPPIVTPWQLFLNFTTPEGVVLRANKTVELKDGTFLRIKDVIHNTLTQEIHLRGHRLQRARDLNGLLERKLNELVLFFEVDQDDTRIPTEQSTVEVPLSEFLKIRSVRFTNHKWPEAQNCNFAEFRNKEHAAAEGGLTVRWKYTCTFADAKDRHHNVYKERVLERLNSGECTPGFELEDNARRNEWREETVLGGAYRPSLEDKNVEGDVVILDNEDSESRVGGSGKRRYSISDTMPEIEQPSKRIRQNGSDGVESTRKSVSEIDLQSSSSNDSVMIENPFESSQHRSQMKKFTLDLPQITRPISKGFSAKISSKQSSPSRIAGQTYTYGDAFCGGGGSSRGATMAGLKLLWGFDFNANACLSWRANFPSSICHQMAADEFVALAKDSSGKNSKKVDILHLSPPCQFFSPAHTVNGKDDEKNVASLFAVQELIDVARPRVVTLEQTFGIACVRFRHYFNALIHMFTAHDFSVRWAIVPLAQWGLPQRRMRLIVIASCPGEPLPKMPLPTHTTSECLPSSSSSLLPYVSVNSTLKAISPIADDHDIESVTWTSDRYMPAWDGSKILPRAMTTSGGQNYHPSGTREFTLREYACLQGFPTGHVFQGKYVKKQIGNAVPPVVGKVLFASIREDLEKLDGVGGPELIE
ncbi:uncharacterized protein RCO7_06443 [Rhynchosporium graminicola]|uniref:DNA (cytosine-5-)-methyltransferase n=1 Tax=Rhynchosporium graminicola TaxID=2792576 RepID=A0A1E1KL85_9HELO|nr:uncharacterized protein RCO7_06443 [Rhynchosporium commune]